MQGSELPERENPRRRNRDKPPAVEVNPTHTSSVSPAMERDTSLGTARPRPAEAVAEEADEDVDEDEEEDSALDSMAVCLAVSVNLAPFKEVDLQIPGPACGCLPITKK